MKEVRAFELVLIGHPDKVCDLVSKTICDANKGGRNAIECCWGNKLFTVNGETDRGWTGSQMRGLVHGILLDEIGLTQDEVMSIEVVNNLNVQSSEINKIVGESGTGDNGIYFGGYHRVYTPVVSRMKDMCVALNANVLREWGYRTDGKFIFHVDGTGKVLRLTINCASFDGTPNREALETFIRTFSGAGTQVFVNPKGNWHNCHGFADCGLTGRKLACDGSCGLFSHGGGAIFGKDISKADVTVPLYLSYLAERYIGKKFGIIPNTVCGFSSSSIIGDTYLDVYRNGKTFGRVPFSEMKDYVNSRDLNVFGALK